MNKSQYETIFVTLLLRLGVGEGAFRHGDVEADVGQLDRRSIVSAGRSRSSHRAAGRRAPSRCAGRPGSAGHIGRIRGRADDDAGSALGRISALPLKSGEPDSSGPSGVLVERPARFLADRIIEEGQVACHPRRAACRRCHTRSEPGPAASSAACRDATCPVRSVWVKFGGHRLDRADVRLELAGPANCARRARARRRRSPAGSKRARKRASENHFKAPGISAPQLALRALNAH